MTPLTLIFLTPIMSSWARNIPARKEGFSRARPLQNIHAYRDHVDRAMGLLIEETPSQEWKKMAHLITLGLHHEQQHQELILTDIKHVLAQNPLFPAAYASTPSAAMRASPPPKPQWIDFEGGLFTIGSEREGSSTFAFDNEGPQHECFLQPFALANRLITNGEYLEFIEDKGYERAEFWLSDGWAHRAAEGWQAPLYWLRSEDGGLMNTRFAAESLFKRTAPSFMSAITKPAPTHAGRERDCPRE